MLIDATQKPASLSFVSGLGELAPAYDLVLCDVWGVLHDGVTGFGPARDALARFRQGGGTVVLVSNAPRPGHVVGQQLAGFGVTADSYDAIVTSGDLTRLSVEERLPQRLCHIGPERDLPIYEGLDVTFAPVEKADYVVCTGLVDDEIETVADYAPLLRTMRQRDLWMLCANPDLVVERGAQLVYCAGAIAQAYEELGGSTYYPGKPHRPIYEHALRVASEIRGGRIDKARTIAIGDAIRTDVAGARGFGIDALMIARGIHAAEIGLGADGLEPERVKAWLAGQEAQPTAIQAALTWD
jgi:HAD superfamily hydrolase (TIGR01459 family)